MKFSKLSEYFEKLEATSKRLEMFEILSSLFKEANNNEIDKIIYLCQEQLLPAFHALEIGMAEKMVEKAIAKMSGRDKKEILQNYKKLGDLGIVAEKLIIEKRTLTKPEELNIEEVYEKLLQIARNSGKGSVEKKISMLSGLFSSCDAREARYITRFVLGRLRLGIGDPTVMDAMSKALSGDRMKLRPEIERAYNLCSDLGIIGKTLFSQGINALKEFHVTVGLPIRMALAERLPSAEDIIKKIGKCAVEIKYDGLRLAVHKDGEKIEIFSRNQERMTPMFPDIAEGIKKQISAKKAILEGEAVAYNEETGEFLPFQVTITRKRKYKIEEMAKEMPLVLFAFDILYVDGKDMTKMPYIERTKKLQQIMKKGFNIRMAEKIITSDPAELEKYFQNSIERGTEGIIAKRLDAPYQAGARNFNWIKLKRSYKGELQDTIDVVIVGYFKGRGMRAKFGIGALLACVYDEKSDSFKTIARVGSGLTEENWIKIRKELDKIKIEKKHARVDSFINADIWTEPKIVFTVMADEITKSPVHTAGKTEKQLGYALRFPRIQGWIRQDKKAEDATTTTEIEKIFEMQKKIKAGAV